MDVFFYISFLLLGEGLQKINAEEVSFIDNLSENIGPQKNTAESIRHLYEKMSATDDIFSVFDALQLKLK